MYAIVGVVTKEKNIGLKIDCYEKVI